jgi:hypothetical protein
MRNALMQGLIWGGATLAVAGVGLGLGYLLGTLAHSHSPAAQVSGAGIKLPEALYEEMSPEETHERFLEVIRNSEDLRRLHASWPRLHAEEASEAHDEETQPTDGASDAGRKP